MSVTGESITKPKIAMEALQKERVQTPCSPYSDEEYSHELSFILGSDMIVDCRQGHTSVAV